MDQDKPRTSWVPLLLIIVVAGLALTFVTIKILRGEPATPNIRPAPEPAPAAKEPPKVEPPPVVKEPPKGEPPPVVKEPPKPEIKEPPPQDNAALQSKLDAEAKTLAGIQKEIESLEATPDTPARRRKLNLLKAREDAQREEVAALQRKLGITPAPVVDKPVAPNQDRERQRALWESLKKESETLQGESKWATALSRLQQAKEQCPEYADQIDPQIRVAGQYLRDACAACDKALGRAKKELADKHYLYALRSAREARTQAPDVAEKNKEIDQLVADIKNQALLSDQVRIPKHAYTVGDAENSGHPVRRLENKTILMDATEVTIEMFALYLLDSGAQPPPHWKGMDFTRNLGNFANLPMSSVTQAEAESFARWAGKRLPTEEEWERAARFIDGRTYPWGDKWGDADGQPGGNAIDLVAGSARDKIEVRPVRSFPNGRSAEGVYDLAGNVWEWTATRVDLSVEGAPVTTFVLKGGSFLTQKEACRGCARLLEEPDIRHLDVGFRCVRDAE